MRQALKRSYVKLTMLNMGAVSFIIIILLYVIHNPAYSSAIQISDLDIKNYKGFSFTDGSSHSLKENIVNIKTTNKENFSKTLYNMNFSREDVNKVINVIRRKYDLNGLKSGKKIIITYENANSKDNQEKNITLTSLRFNIDNTKELIVRKSKDNFVANVNFIPLTIKYSKLQEVVNRNFNLVFVKNNLSSQSVKEVTQSFCNNLDLSKDLNKGDKIELLYEKLYDADGAFVKNGNIIYASLNLKNGKKYNLYRFQTSNKNIVYLSDEGKETKKEVLKNPIRAAKITSKFGMRIHPIHGHSRMHKGIDLAARAGTPVFSAGAGVVTEATRRHGYGKYIKIDHGKSLATAYAHLSKFAPGLSKGDKVSQGQLIGFVGETGGTTGAHLHYETLYKNVHVNPLTIKFSKSQTLSKQELSKFKAYRKQIITALKSVKTHNEIALNNIRNFTVSKN